MSGICKIEYSLQQNLLGLGSLAKNLAFNKEITYEDINLCKCPQSWSSKTEHELDSWMIHEISPIFIFCFKEDYQRVFSGILILIIEYLNVNRYNTGQQRERERKAKKSQREIGNSFTTYSSILYFCISIFYIITVTLLDVSYVTLELLHNYGNSGNMSSKNMENEEYKRYISKLSVSCNCLSLNMKYEEH